MKLFAEQIRVKKGLIGDVNAGAESARVHLQKSNQLAIVVELAAGTGTDFEYTLRQHDAASAGNSADLVSTVPVYHKADVDAEFVRLDVDAATVAIPAVDTAASTVVIEVYEDDLTEGFEYVSLVLSAAGAARIASVSYMADTKFKPAYQEEL